VPQVTDELVALAESRVDSRGLRSVFGLGVDELELDWLGLRQPCWQVSHAPRQLLARCWCAARAYAPLGPRRRYVDTGATPLHLDKVLLCMAADLESERASEHMGRLHGAARRYAVLHTRLRRYLDDGLGADEGFDLLPVAIVSVAAITVSKRSARTSSSDVSM